MILDDPIDRLQVALEKPLKTQVVVRYAVRRHLGATQFEAELAATLSWAGRSYLGHLAVMMSVNDGAKVDASRFEATDLSVSTAALTDMVERWGRRSFDDWFHDAPFVGAFEILRDHQPYTSAKLPATDVRWHVLTGVLLGQIDRFEREHRKIEPPMTGSVLRLMKNRFGAFAGQSMGSWANSTFRN
jgi:hypothetical protein